MCIVCGEATEPAAHVDDGGTETKKATCTETGVIMHYCVDCGAFLDSEEISIQGHTWVEATCTEPKTCSSCGETEGEALGHIAGADGLCTRCGASCEAYDSDSHILFAENTVSASGEVIMNLKFKISKLVLAKVGRVEIQEESNKVFNDYAVEIITGDELRAMKKINGMYVLTRGIASYEMTGDVTVTFYDTEGNKMPIWNSYTGRIVDSLTRTVVDYAREMLSSDTNDAKTKNLIAAMLVYGGYAQKQFEVDVDNLAYSILDEYDDVEMPDINSVTAASINKAVTTAGSSIGFEYKQQSVVLDSKVSLRLYCKFATGRNLNSEYTRSLNSIYNSLGASMVGSRVLFEITDIAASDWDKDFEITLTERATYNTYTVKSSVLAWVNESIQTSSNSNVLNLAKAMYLYNQAANAYFE